MSVQLSEYRADGTILVVLVAARAPTFVLATLVGDGVAVVVVAVYVFRE